jgi:hypothetical protein
MWCDTPGAKERKRVALCSLPFHTFYDSVVLHMSRAVKDSIDRSRCDGFYSKESDMIDPIEGLIVKRYCEPNQGMSGWVASIMAHFTFIRIAVPHNHEITYPYPEWKQCLRGKLSMEFISGRRNTEENLARNCSDIMGMNALVNLLCCQEVTEENRLHQTSGPGIKYKSQKSTGKPLLIWLGHGVAGARPCPETSDYYDA